MRLSFRAALFLLLPAAFLGAQQSTVNSLPDRAQVPLSFSTNPLVIEGDK